MFTYNTRYKQQVINGNFFLPYYFFKCNKLT